MHNAMTAMDQNVVTQAQRFCQRGFMDAVSTSMTTWFLVHCV